MNKEVQQKYVELQMLNQQIKQVQEQFIFLQQQLNELNILENSITELKDIKKDSELFSSIGPGIFINSKLNNPDSVIVNIGAGVLIEKKLPEAQELIKHQINNINSSLETINEQLTNAINYSEKLTEELNELAIKEK